MAKSIRHSYEDALSESEFDQLVEATDGLSKPYDAECLFVLIAAGRLGMRAGEISHMREDWIDYDKEQIQIPNFDKCDHGENGDVCGYCRAQAQLAVENGTYEDLDEALQYRWQPKTTNSARTIPYDHDEFVKTVITEFFRDRDRWPHSRVSINRRVDRVLEAAGYPTDKCYPHSLRATAASHHAYRGLPAPALQALFGWSHFNTAQKYLRLSGGATKRALNDVYGD